MQHDTDQFAIPDARLLRRFVREGAQAAFGALVARHYRLVYSVCLRDVGDISVAEDAAQAVFLILARKAPTLHGDGSLAGWLYRTARLVSKNAVRREARVRRIEQRAARHTAQETETEQGGLWRRIDPSLHAALDTLGGVEREAVLLRFFEDRSLLETGAALGLSEDAARMRVSRALEKLRRFLVKEGVAVSASALAGLLAGKAAHAAPVPAVPWAAQTASGAAGAATHVQQLAQGATKIMWITRASITAALVGVALGGGIWGARVFKPLQAPPVPLAVRPRTALTIDAPAQEALTQAATATAALGTLKADVTAIVAGRGAQKGTLAFKRPNLMRIVFPGPAGSTSVSDGTYSWSLFTGTKKLYKFEAAPDGHDLSADDETTPFIGFFFDPSLAGLHVEPDTDPPAVRYAGEETWQGLRCQVIELSFQKLMRHTLRAYFGPDHLLRRCVWTTHFGDGTTRTDDVFLSNVVVNAPLSPALFTFTPPAGGFKMNDVAQQQQSVREMQKEHPIPAPILK